MMAREDFSSADQDWLDDVDGKPRPKAAAKKPLQGRAEVLEPEAANATIVEIFPNQASALLDGQERPVLCGYRMATLASRGPERERSPVCVGDRVLVQAGVIVGRCRRRNSLVRRAPNARNPLRHAVVANIDLLVVVASARDPEFTQGIVDRFFAAAAAQNIPALLCVNKVDLLEPGAPRPWASTPGAAEPCSARDGTGTQALASALRGKTVAFCGHSGVGKTSLLRRLLGDESFGRVGSVSEASGKGRHTTTGAILIPGPDGSRFIDTPGIMNFDAVVE
jgi:ribosome small subunit-dependent GTPase A